jgi:hypothetical protein
VNVFRSRSFQRSQKSHLLCKSCRSALSSQLSERIENAELSKISFSFRSISKRRGSKSLVSSSRRRKRNNNWKNPSDLLAPSKGAKGIKGADSSIVLTLDWRRNCNPYRDPIDQIGNPHKTPQNLKLVKNTGQIFQWGPKKLLIWWRKRASALPSNNCTWKSLNGRSLRRSRRIIRWGVIRERLWRANYNNNLIRLSLIMENNFRITTILRRWKHCISLMNKTPSLLRKLMIFWAKSR